MVIVDNNGLIFQKLAMDRVQRCINHSRAVIYLSHEKKNEQSHEIAMTNLGSMLSVIESEVQNVIDQINRQLDFALSEQGISTQMPEEHASSFNQQTDNLCAVE